jgi:RNase P subunit RPR2
MTKKKAEEMEQPKKQSETPIEPEIKEVIVEKPIEVKDLSQTERANLIEQVKQQDIQDHLDTEKQRIKEIICPKCEKPLKINPDEYLKMGNKPREIECPSCERLIRVYIDYRQSPETSEALITTKARGFAWETKQPGTWKDKDTVKWVENEVERAKQGNPSLSPEGQIIFRIQQLILKKQKVIK